MNEFLWGVYPYLCIVLFFVVPIFRMAFRPFSWSTRASGLFSQPSLRVASLLLHWGLLLVLLGHLAGLFGGLLGSEGSIRFFFWSGLVGGAMVLIGSVVALFRRIIVPEVRAMSQADDYGVHLFIIPIVALALYQVIAHRIFGISYTAASWTASLWTLSPQPELMASASLITKLHVFFALTFFAYFPFTKLVHVWTFPINYLVRPYQSMRTVRYRLQRKWEFALRSDKSWLVYGLAAVALVFVAAAAMLGRISWASAATDGNRVGAASNGRLTGFPLYVSQCARCHGVAGRGDGAGAGSPTFGAPPRDLTAGQYAFISTTNRVASDEDLHRTIRYGLPSSGMPAFDKLSDAQVQSLVVVLNDFWENRPAAGPRIEVPARPEVTEAIRTTGANLYRETCASCHGEGGQGDGVLAASLPLRPANLAAGEFKAGADAEQIYLRIAAGTPPFMPPFRTSLSPEELWAVVSYIESEFLNPE